MIDSSSTRYYSRPALSIQLFNVSDVNRVSIDTGRVNATIRYNMMYFKQASLYFPNQ